jgi:hypothetical protein
MLLLNLDVGLPSPLGNTATSLIAIGRILEE